MIEKVYDPPPDPLPRSAIYGEDVYEHSYDDSDGTWVFVWIPSILIVETREAFKVDSYTPLELPPDPAVGSEHAPHDAEEAGERPADS